MLGICFFTKGEECTGEPVWEGEKGGCPLVAIGVLGERNDDC